MNRVVFQMPLSRKLGQIEILTKAGIVEIKGLGPGMCRCATDNYNQNQQTTPEYNEDALGTGIIGNEIFWH